MNDRLGRAFRALLLLICSASASVCTETSAKDEPSTAQIKSTFDWNPLDNTYASRKLLGHVDQSCDLASQTLADIRASLDLTASAARGEAGQLSLITWRHAQPSPRAPTYLLIAVDEPVRFRGEGFYVLSPGAKAPFGLTQLKEKTRVVVPIHVSGSPQGGSIKVRPLNAGALTLSAAIVGVSRCGESVDPAPKRLALPVDAGRMSIAIADRYALETPDQVIAAPNGRRRIAAIGPRFRIINPHTGSMLGNHLGTEPRFSPTGRFVIAKNQDELQLFDAEDGEFIRSLGNADIGWDNKDSFIVTGERSWGLIGFDTSLQEEASRISVGNSCRTCPGVTDSNFKIDLENNVVVGFGTLNRVSAHNMTVDDNYSDDQEELCSRPSTVSCGYKRHGSFIDYISKYAVTNVSLPKTLESLDKIKFTHLSDWSGRDDKIFPQLRAAVEEPLIVPKDHQLRATSLRDGFQQANRSLGSATEAPHLFTPRRDRRLSELNLDVGRGLRATRVSTRSVLQSMQEKDTYLFRPDRRIRVLSPFGDGDCGKALRTQAGLDLHIEDLQVAEIKGNKFSLMILAGHCGFGSAVGLSEPATFMYDTRRPGQLFKLSTAIGDDYDELAAWSFDCAKEAKSCAIDAQLFSDRFMVLWSKKKKTIEIYDIVRYKFIGAFISLTSIDAVDRVVLEKNLKYAIQLNKDGRFELFSLKQAHTKALRLAMEASQPSLLGLVIDDEVVAWTPEGVFDATPEGAHHVAVRFAGREGDYTLEQYSKALRAPNLIDRVLADDVPPRTSFPGHPPSIRVTPTFSEHMVSASILVGSEPVVEVKIFQDGRLTDTIAVDSSSRSAAIEVPRLAGARWMAFLARGADGLFSQAATFDAGPVSGRPRRLHVLAVGIDRYTDATIPPLAFAAKDAARLAATLEARRSGSLDVSPPSLLVDDQASRSAILATLKERLATAQPSDTFALFIAGHGFRAEDGRFFLATTETRMDDLAGTALPWSELAAVLAASPARVVTFLDTCHSGSAGTELFATNGDASKTLLDAVPASIVVFSASRGRELAEETPAEDGGVFTTSLVRALGDRSTDLNRNGMIEASELYIAMKRAVVAKTAGRQTPWFSRNEMVGDFAPF